MTGARPRLGRLIICEWRDIQVDSGWEYLGKATGPARCLSVGFVIARDADSITLASMYGESHDAKERESNARQCIPIGCIASWEYLKRASGRDVRRLPVAKKEGTP